MEKEALHVPRIIRLQQAWEMRPKVIGERPTWESSRDERRGGVWCRSRFDPLERLSRRCPLPFLLA